MSNDLTEILRIDKVIYGGDGLARREDGKTAFVPFTAAGELVEVRVIQEKKNYFRALPVRIIEASPDRVEPPCPVFGRCGGCAYQHLSYEAQLKLKSSQVRESLERIGKFQNPPVAETVPSPLQYGYRTRIAVHNHHGRLGFFDVTNREIVDVAQCPIAAETVNKRLAGLRERLQRRGAVRNRVTLRSDSDEEGFTQVNEAARPNLLRLIGESLPENAESLVDAYCGNGLYGFALAERFARITGIEWDSRSIEQARKQAEKLPDTTTYEFRQGDVTDMLPDALRDARPNALILNPPRDGLAELIPTRIAAATAPETGSALTYITYVSCNPASLARDLRRILTETGDRFSLHSVVPIDMFPQTAQVETVVSLVRNS